VNESRGQVNPMPVCVAIMCENCERIYLLAHPENVNRIRFDPRFDTHAYILKCMCQSERRFDKTQTLPYRVSDTVYGLGYASRDQYEVMPNAKSK
jgi:hypothetical protein